MGTDKKLTDKELISVETDVLKERLNKVYQHRRDHSLIGHKGRNAGLHAGDASQGVFEYLWDLKERALLEHRASVEVPGNWLAELEEDQGKNVSH
ncbi:MAG: hypothetical protein KGS72_21035 [Cyanobacteria bacterium REEB67]|nr:hypothetical protein [Cyanobacteria bacterium REEB67]